MTRIGFADHLFLRMHHGIGNPVFNQFLWWFDSAIPVDELEKLRTNLSSGLLSRKVESPSLPTARHRWIASAVSLPLDLTDTEIPSDAVLAWAEQRVGGDIDPESGIGWQLAAVPIAGGGMVVSLVCSHMVADGAAMVAAVRQAHVQCDSATDDSATNDSATDRAVGADALGVRPSFVGGLVDDLGDTVGQLKPIVRWAVGTAVTAAASVVTGKREPASQAHEVASPHRRDVDRTSGQWSAPYVVVECSASEWNAAAAEWGGTSNSLFIGVMTAISEMLGRATPGDELRWSLPYNNRGPGDIDSNSTKIIPVRVPVSERGDLDLTRIRKASKTAFTEFATRQAAGTTTEAIPLALIQMLPDALVAKLPRPSDGAEGLCSNLGALPDDFTTISGVKARSVAARATFAGADADFARTLGGGSTAWATATAGAVTIALHGMDPDRMVSDDALRVVVAEVLDRWAIGYRFW